MSRAIFLRACVAAVCVSSCGTTEPVQGPDASARLDAGGGLKFGDLTLSVPPGAVSSALTLTAQLADTPLAGALGPTYELLPDGLVFERPVELCIAVPAAAKRAPPGAVIPLRLYTREGGLDVSIPGSVTRGDVVCAEILHFTPFAVGPDPGVIVPEAGPTPDQLLDQSGVSFFLGPVHLQVSVPARLLYLAVSRYGLEYLLEAVEPQAVTVSLSGLTPGMEIFITDGSPTRSFIVDAFGHASHGEDLSAGRRAVLVSARVSTWVIDAGLAGGGDCETIGGTWDSTVKTCTLRPGLGVKTRSGSPPRAPRLIARAPVSTPA